MLIEPDHPVISISRQCDLLGLSRSSYYYESSSDENSFNLEIMRLMDEQYTRTPFYGVPRMTAFLRRKDYEVNPKRIRRLMRLMGIEAIYPKRRLSKPCPEHIVYPYLLKGLDIDRPDLVWCSDITYIRLLHGFVYLVAIMGLVQPLCPGLGPFHDFGRVFLYPCLENGPGPRQAGYFQHRPGVAVHERGLHNPP